MSGVLRSLAAKSRSLPLRQIGRRSVTDDQDLVGMPRYPMRMTYKVLIFLPFGIVMWYPMFWCSVNTENFKKKSWTWTGAWTEEVWEEYNSKMAERAEQ